VVEATAETAEIAEAKIIRVYERAAQVKTHVE
jgi:hypothetical protein